MDNVLNKFLDINPGRGGCGGGWEGSASPLPLLLDLLSLTNRRKYKVLKGELQKILSRK